MQNERRIEGDGVQNWQNYIEERLEDGGDTTDLARLNAALEREEASLAALHHERAQGNARPNINALISEAELRVDDMRQRVGSIDPNGTNAGQQMRVQDEARNQMTDRAGERLGQGNLKPE